VSAGGCDAGAHDTPIGQPELSEDQAVGERGVHHVAEDRGVERGARVAEAAKERGHEHHRGHPQLARQARHDVGNRAGGERGGRAHQAHPFIQEPSHGPEHHDHRRQHRVEPVPHPRAAFAMITRPVRLRHEHLYAARGAVEGREERLQHDAAEADRPALGGAESSDHRGVDQVHRGGRHGREHDRVRERENLADAPAGGAGRAIERWVGGEGHRGCGAAKRHHARTFTQAALAEPRADE
jgi:hypothetical protein